MLLILSLVTVILVVAALAAYLVAIAWALRRAARSVAGIADALEAVRDLTRPLAEKLTHVNGALGALLGGLESADGHVTRIADACERG